MELSKTVDKGIMKTGDTVYESGKLVGKLIVSAGVGIGAGILSGAVTAVELGGVAIAEFRKNMGI